MDYISGAFIIFFLKARKYLNRYVCIYTEKKAQSDMTEALSIIKCIEQSTMKINNEKK